MASKKSTAPALITFKKVTKTYGTGPSAVEVLHGIDFEVKKGEFVAIMGASGGGKSTLMNIIGTLDKLTTGEYFFEGQRIDQLNSVQLAQLRNQRIGFVFQSFNLLTRINVSKNIERPMMYGQIPPNQRQERIKSVLEKMQLADKIKAMPLELSGGQQQRIAIARALVMNPALILADEPTGALDSKTATLVMEELKRINQESGTTLILVTHDQKTADYADRIIRIADGRIIKSWSLN